MPIPITMLGLLVVGGGLVLFRFSFLRRELASLISLLWKVCTRSYSSIAVSFAACCVVLLRVFKTDFLTSTMASVFISSVYGICCVLVVILLCDKLSALEDLRALRNNRVSEGRTWEETLKFKTKQRKADWNLKSGRLDVVSYLQEQHLMSKVAAEECLALIELILRDFVHYWYDWVSDDNDFIRDIQRMIAHALGVFIQSARARITPLLFVADRVCYIVTRLLQVYSQAIQTLEEDPDTKRLLLNTSSLTLIQWNQLQEKIVEEFRQRGRLHPVFAWDQSETSESKSNKQPGSRFTLAPDLTPAEFQSSERLGKCEKLYLKHLSSKLTRKVLKEQDANSPATRHLLREILANTVLLPVTYIFTPAMISWWAEAALAVMGDSIEKATQAEASKAEDSYAVLESRHLDNIMAVGVTPPGFPPDSGWQYFAGSIGPEEARLLLGPEQEGSFFFSKPLQETQSNVFTVWLRVSSEQQSPPRDDGQFESTKAFRIRCAPDTYTVLEKEVVYSLTSRPGLITDAVNTQFRSLSELLEKLKPILRKGITLSSFLQPGSPKPQHKIEQREEPRLSESIFDLKHEVNLPASLQPLPEKPRMCQVRRPSKRPPPQQWSLEPLAEPLETPQRTFANTQSSSRMVMQTTAPQDTGVSSRKLQPDNQLQLPPLFLAEELRNIYLMELRGAVDEITDFLSFTDGDSLHSNSEIRPIRVDSSNGGVRSVTRLLMALYQALKHEMKLVSTSEPVTEIEALMASVPDVKDKANWRRPRIIHHWNSTRAEHSRRVPLRRSFTKALQNKFHMTQDQTENSAQRDSETVKHHDALEQAAVAWVERESDDDAKVRILHIKSDADAAQVSKRNLVSDYFQAAEEDSAEDTKESLHCSPDTEINSNSEKEGESDDSHHQRVRREAETLLIKQQLGDLLCNSSKDLETEGEVSVATFENLWWWIHYYRRDFMDNEDEISQKPVNLRQMSRATGGIVYLLFWLTLGRLAEAVRALVRNENVLEQFYSPVALVRIRSEHRKLLDLLEMLSGYHLELNFSCIPNAKEVPSATEKRRSLWVEKNLTGTALINRLGLRFSKKDEQLEEMGEAVFENDPQLKLIESIPNIKEQDFLSSDSIRFSLDSSASSKVRAKPDVLHKSESLKDLGSHYDEYPYLNFHRNTDSVEKHRAREHDARSVWTRKKLDRQLWSNPSSPTDSQPTRKLLMSRFERAFRPEEHFRRSIPNMEEPAYSMPVSNNFDGRSAPSPIYESNEEAMKSAWMVSECLQHREKLQSLKRKAIWLEAHSTDRLYAKVVSQQKKSSVRFFSIRVSRSVFDESSDTSGSGSSNQTSVIDDSKVWEITRRFSDFDALHKHLQKQVGVAVQQCDKPKFPQLPPKHKLFGSMENKLFGSSDQQWLEQRRLDLDRYIQDLLSHPLLGCCFELYLFMDALGMQTPAQVPSVASNDKTQLFSNSRSKHLSVSDAILAKKHKLSQLGPLKAIRRLGAKLGDDAHFALSTHGAYLPLDYLATSGDDLNVEIGKEEREESSTAAPRKVEKKREDSPTRSSPDAVTPEVLREIRPEILQRMEDRIVDLFNEVFDTNKLSMVRRRLLIVLRQAARIFFSATINKWVASSSLNYVSDPYTAKTLQFVRESVWPGGQLAKAVPAESEESQHETRLRVRERLLGAIPSSLESVIGRTQVEQGVLRLFDMLQNPLLLKSICYMLLDLILIEVFPDTATFVDGAECLL